MKRALLVVSALALCGAGAASAQSAGEPPPVRNQDPDEATAVSLVGFNIAGMASFPVGAGSDAFNPGGGFAAGVMFRPRPFIGFQIEYSYSWYGLKHDVIPDNSLDGNHIMQYWDLNVMVRPARAKGFGFYVIGGPGIYHRMAEINKVTGAAVGAYCDPILFFCYPTAAPIQDTLASRSSTDFGVNGGIGMYMVFRPPLRVYLEGRYHFIWGPDFNTGAGKKRSGDGQYIPITLGLEF